MQGGGSLGKGKKVNKCASQIKYPVIYYQV